MIGVIDYGLGNIRAFLNIYNRLNIPTMAVRTASELSLVNHIILPGIGSFDWAMERLNASGMRGVLDKLVQDRMMPVLGVCVGMQMLAYRSEEGESLGLGCIPGQVKRFDKDSSKFPLPHMGWNDVAPLATDGLFRSMENPRFYFLHSYYFSAENSEHILAKTEYDGVFTSAVHAGNVFGVQFHPEKSHHWGIQLLKNFAEV